MPPLPVITGLGFITSIGHDRASVGRSLRELAHGFERVEFFGNPNLPVKVAAWAAHAPSLAKLSAERHGVKPIPRADFPRPTQKKALPEKEGLDPEMVRLPGSGSVWFRR